MIDSPRKFGGILSGWGQVSNSTGFCATFSRRFAFRIYSFESRMTVNCNITISS